MLHIADDFIDGGKCQGGSHEIIDFEAAYFGTRLLRILNINCDGLQKNGNKQHWGKYCGP